MYWENQLMYKRYNIRNPDPFPDPTICWVEYFTTYIRKEYIFWKNLHRCAS
jgi:hypothetical protein